VLICLGFSAALAWSYFGHLDVYAVAQGKIQPSGRSKVVQPLDAGKVATILVENGARVSAGDVMLELDATEAFADTETQGRELEAARAEVARRRTAIEIADSGALAPRPIRFRLDTDPAICQREREVLAADIAQLASARESLRAQLLERSAQIEHLRA